ncbi:PP2C family serine/threonine-protein phosphatase [Rhodococcus globerulus]|uniref:PP2C family protein-serine/threonine phosphatase n=1 Tax=Rhodococcus globerulus TaxID=33008 RepID=UPI00301818C6
MNSTIIWIIIVVMVIVVLWKGRALIWNLIGPKVMRRIVKTDTFRQWEQTEFDRDDTSFDQEPAEGSRDTPVPNRRTMPLPRNAVTETFDDNPRQESDDSRSRQMKLPPPAKPEPTVHGGANSPLAPQVAALKIIAAGVSERGLRSANEDAWLATDRVIVVADGVGNNPGGKLAADLAAGTIGEVVKLSAREPDRDLRNATEIADAVIREKTAESSELHGMATTLDAVVFYDRGVYGAHLGDGRAYLVTGEGSELLTVDDVLDAGNPQTSNVLTRFLGGEQNAAQPHVWQRELVAGDRIVVVSDGVWGFLGNRMQISTLLSSTLQLKPSDAAALLVDFALRNGGNDNATAVVADVVPRSAADIPHR